ncbi:hypothetical protein SPFM14_00279 [Salmonella phage SPFM14]|nr:hypothetical protein SPFM14_00279 [Salmonella phage SPFM14]
MLDIVVKLYRSILVIDAEILLAYHAIDNAIFFPQNMQPNNVFCRRGWSNDWVIVNILHEEDCLPDAIGVPYQQLKSTKSPTVSYMPEEKVGLW